VVGVLGRCNHVEPAVEVQVRVGGVRLKGDVGLRLGVERALDDDFAVRQHLLDVAYFHAVRGGYVALGLEADREHVVDLGFRVDDGLVVERALEVEDGVEHFVLHLDECDRLARGRLVDGRDDRYFVADVSDVGVEDELVVGARFRVSLAGAREGDARHVGAREHARDARPRTRRSIRCARARAGCG